MRQQDDRGVVRRFLEVFQQCVLRSSAQQVSIAQDENLPLSADGFVAESVDQKLADDFDADGRSLEVADTRIGVKAAEKAMHDAQVGMGLRLHEMTIGAPAAGRENLRLADVRQVFRRNVAPCPMRAEQRPRERRRQQFAPRALRSVKDERMSGTTATKRPDQRLLGPGLMAYRDGPHVE